MSGDADIHRCYFDGNRHAVAASGEHGAGYTFRSNVVGPRSYLQAVDMHPPGGSHIDVRHNHFDALADPRDGSRSTPMYLRDGPTNGGEIVGNRFASAPAPGPDDICGAEGDAWVLDRVGSPADAGIHIANNLTGGVCAEGERTAAVGPRR